MNKDIGDIIDRWSILKLKYERIGSPEVVKEYEVYQKEMLLLSKKKYVPEISQLMYDVNGFIWVLESGLKGGKESLKNPHYLFDQLNEGALVNIGIASVLIRNFNHVRISIKNLVNKIEGQGHPEKKGDHLSC